MADMDIFTLITETSSKAGYYGCLAVKAVDRAKTGEFRWPPDVWPPDVRALVRRAGTLGNDALALTDSARRIMRLKEWDE